MTRPRTDRSPAEVDALNLERWYPALAAWTMPTRFRVLSDEEQESLVSVHSFTLSDGGHSTEEQASAIASLECWCDASIGELGGAGFVRLGSRSPKDSWLGIVMDPPFLVRSGKKALDLLADSERAYADLTGLVMGWGKKPETQSLAMRQWVGIPAASEFRCFVVGRELRGVSQYEYGSHFPELDDAACRGDIERALRALVGEVAGRLPCDDVVLDAWYDRAAGTARLVELNPLWVQTDPCLVSWDWDFSIFEFRTAGRDAWAEATEADLEEWLSQ